MSERLTAELELLRTVYPDAELRDDLWARIPVYPLPDGIWDRPSCEVAFRFALPGQPPYAFWVRPSLRLKSGAVPQNYTDGVETGFGPGWGQFSWSADEWLPGSDVHRGANMLRWAMSFALRLAEGA